MHTSDTVEHDIANVGSGNGGGGENDEVAVYNTCSDTTRHMNGVVTNMHPSEGVWLFRCVSAVYEYCDQENRSAGQERGDYPSLVICDGAEPEEEKGQRAVVVRRGRLGSVHLQVVFCYHFRVVHVVFSDGFVADVAEVAQEDQAERDDGDTDDDAEKDHFTRLVRMRIKYRA